MRIKLGLALAGLSLGTLLAGTASAQRYVAVNGQRLNPLQISTLDQWHCGPAPDGRYWLNLETGIWGYASDPTPRGRITDNCYAQQPQRRQSLSERGLLYSPGELLR